jgi:hypothetical protein
VEPLIEAVFLVEQQRVRWRAQHLSDQRGPASLAADDENDLLDRPERVSRSHQT